MKITISFDVEPDIHNGKYEGISQGLSRAKKILDKYNKKAIFFVTCDCIEKYPEVFLKLKKQGHEIALHGYRHERFDDLTKDKKEEAIIKSVHIFEKYLKLKPLGFRAPQHSIDSDTLKLLEKHGFEYDSSYYPLNLLQLLFFPKRFFQWIKIFFSPKNKYTIRKNLTEIPASSLFIPFVSITLRLLPKVMIKYYLRTISLLYKNPVFYAHSWDFIELPESRIDRMFPHSKLLNKLDYLLSLEK